MLLERLKTFPSRRPGWTIGIWLALAVVVGLAAPNLTRLAAEGQSKLLGADAESHRAAELVKACWPDQAYESMAVAALYRPGGLTPADHRLAASLAHRFETAKRPGPILRVLGPDSQPEIAERLVSEDGEMSLVVVPLDVANVSPAADLTIQWLQNQAEEVMRETPPADGLKLLWTGDATLGRDYMHQVQVSLDRAAVVTVFLLLIVLLLVYRSFWLALVPLTTIALSLIISRGVLAWLNGVGWQISPLVELFLVALLFGTGTDFCLFLSWRFGEHFNPRNPAGVMRATLSRSFVPLVTSAGTIIVGLMLMGVTKFKLFSTTGPSVALGLAITLIASLTLTPALLITLARLRARSFENFAARSQGGVWESVGRKVMARPFRSWVLTLGAMVPLVAVSFQTHFVMDLVGELPASSSSAENLRLLLSKFDPGMTSPLTIVLESDADFTSSQGLALIDDVSRLLSHQRMHHEVRSATQPLGSPAPLNRARLSSRLGEVDEGFQQLAEGGAELEKGLNAGAAKLRAALWLQQQTGLNILGGVSPPSSSKPEAPPTPQPAASAPFSEGLKTASTALLWSQGAPTSWNVAALNAGFNQLVLQGAARSAKERMANPGLFDAAARLVTGASATPPAAPEAKTPPPPQKPEDPAETLLRELTRAAEGAGQIADGAEQAHRELSAILEDPLGRRALDRLLVTPETVQENPELLESFAAYITPDGRHARIDVTQAARVFSNDAMNQVQTIRERLDDYLGEYQGIHVTAVVAGANAESADIRDLTDRDQVVSWFVVPIGVFLVLMLALREPWACVNLVATMVLTYVFALGATHLTFVTLLGAEGLDWKVPYFLFVILVAVGVDYNIFLMTRLHEETTRHGFRGGIVRAIGQTGSLISSAAAITACSFASFLFSPLVSLRQLGFALVVGIAVDALLVRPVLVPCGHWLLRRSREALAPRYNVPSETLRLTSVPD